MNFKEYNTRALYELVPKAQTRASRSGQYYEDLMVQPDSITIDATTYDELDDKSGYVRNQNGTYTKKVPVELPTKEVFEAKVMELINAEPREVRDNIVIKDRKKVLSNRDIRLQKTDYLMTTDFPFPSEEIKQAWVRYRQQLRDLPVTGISVDPENQYRLLVVWPTPPLWPPNVV
jgi:hypothetical protein